MRTMKIEKKLLFNEKINEVNQMEVKAALMYQKESDGSIRASGPLFIRGNMRLMDGTSQVFQEVLDMDVLAPSYKLSNEPFSLKVKDYYADCDEEGICVVIHMEISGLKEDAKTVEEHHQENIAYDMNEPMIPTIEKEASQEIITNEEEIALEDQTSVEAFEDLFEEGDTTYTPYRMIVAKPQDSYSSIAQRYDVSEEALKISNRNKEIQEKSLVILPF